MPKEVRVELVGSCRKFEDDSFKGSDGQDVPMTRVKIMTGSIETQDEQIFDVNYLWKVGPNGKDKVRPSFLANVKVGAPVKLPVRVVAQGNEVTVRGV